MTVIIEVAVQRFVIAELGVTTQREAVIPLRFIRGFGLRRCSGGGRGSRRNGRCDGRGGYGARGGRRCGRGWRSRRRCAGLVIDPRETTESDTIRSGFGRRPVWSRYRHTGLMSHPSARRHWLHPPAGQAQDRKLGRARRWRAPMRGAACTRFPDPPWIALSCRPRGDLLEGKFIWYSEFGAAQRAPRKPAPRWWGARRGDLGQFCYR